MTEDNSQAELGVQHFRQILLWPLQLMPIDEHEQIQTHWELLEAADSPWFLVADEFTEDPANFQERHYSEFVTFLPNVQRMLYGESTQGRLEVPPALRVFRRDDVAQVRLVLREEDEVPTVLDVAHVDLYFFYDLDVAILALEVCTQEITLAHAQDCLYHFGRSYPTYWDENGHGGHCPVYVQWLNGAGEVLAVSDYERKDKYLANVCLNRAANIAAHWAFLLRPMVLDDSDEAGAIRYRLLEYHRMPVLGYLAVDDPHRLTRADFIRLAFVAPADPQGRLPFPESYLRDFETQYCCDRYWDPASSAAPGERLLCSGEALMMVGAADDRYFMGRRHGLLEQFRHQYFLLMLLPHLHKAGLLMMSNRLGEAMGHLDIRDAQSVRRFKRRIRRLKEIYLRFTHRYWFYDVSDQPLAKEVYRLCSWHLSTERLYEEVKEEVENMTTYLDSDQLRRQSNTVLRLTVVTILGLIGTMSTGIGIYLLTGIQMSLGSKLPMFALFITLVILLISYTIVKSKRLADFLEALSDERLSVRAKFSALLDVWRKSKPSQQN